MNQQHLVPIAEAPGLYVDALLCDGDYLRFISVWGRDTEMQEFLARLSLPLKDGGLDAIRVDGEMQYVQIGNIERFEKLTGRMPKENLFGEVTHLWLFDRTANMPDYTGRQALFLFQPEEDTAEHCESLNERLWTTVCETCHLPLLPQWRDVVLEGFTRQGFLRRLEGIGIHGIVISLPELGVETVVTEWIQSGVLTVEGEPLQSPQDPWADAQVISVYTRAQAIDDGVLVDVTEMAREAGFRCPVALSQAVHAECVAWDQEDDHTQVYQDQAGRLWDVLWMASMAARAGGSGRKPFELYCVPRDGKSREPALTTLHLHAGPGDAGELVITILLPNED